MGMNYLERNDDFDRLSERREAIIKRLAAYPTGGRPSYVSADIAHDEILLQNVEAKLSVFVQ